MIELGVSVYPEKESMEDVEQYLKLASHYGFTQVFVSLFSVEGEVEDIYSLFKKFTNIAHQNNMKVIGDANIHFLERIGVDPKNPIVLKNLGIDILRLDGIYGDERDVAIINNNIGIKIQLNASVTEFIDPVLKAGADPSKIIGSFNFYPLRNSGAGVEDVIEKCLFFKERGAETQLFITSQAKNTHGPWPHADGITTIECHRDIPVNLQLRHIVALGNVDQVLFGNAFASESEFKEIKEIMDTIYYYTDNKEGMLPGYEVLIKTGNLTRVPLTIELQDDITEIEKTVINFQKHYASEYVHTIIRSRSRFMFNKYSIEPRISKKEYFEKGDVLVTNNNTKHYKGELHIVKTHIKNDGGVNYVGRVINDELFLLDCIKSGMCFAFI